MAALLRRIRLDVAGVTWTAPLPVAAWLPGHAAPGTTRLTGLGAPAGERIREDALLGLTVRVPEAEWPDLEAVLLVGLTSRDMDFYPDALDLGTRFAVWLESPAPDEDWGPVRSGGYRGVLEADILLRGAYGEVPWTAYFDLTG